MFHYTNEKKKISYALGLKKKKMKLKPVFSDVKRKLSTDIKKNVLIRI